MGGSEEPRRNHFKRVAALIGGGLILLVGIALLVLPGPGLLLVFCGLYVLSQQFPSVEKHVDPMRDRALKAAEESVSSPLRIAGSVLAGLVLIGGGIALGLGLGLFRSLPFSGWSAGSSLILSGIILFALLGYSYRRVSKRRAATPP